jgi:hypothetical protein
MENTHESVNCAYCNRALPDDGPEYRSNWGEPVHQHCRVLLSIDSLSNGEEIAALNALLDNGNLPHEAYAHLETLRDFINEVFEFTKLAGDLVVKNFPLGRS